MPETWEPKLAVLASRAIPDNLIGFITHEARQTAALRWAGDAGLVLLKTRVQRRAVKERPQYPSIEFSDDNDAAQYGKNIVPSVYKVELEIKIQNADPDEAVRQARIYEKAVMSMIVNIPTSTLLTGTGAFAAVLDTIETGFEKLQAGKKGTATNDFLQVFQIRPTWNLEASFKS